MKTISSLSPSLRAAVYLSLPFAASCIALHHLLGVIVFVVIYRSLTYINTLDMIGGRKWNLSGTRYQL